MSLAESLPCCDISVRVRVRSQRVGVLSVEERRRSSTCGVGGLVEDVVVVSFGGGDG